MKIKGKTAFLKSRSEQGQILGNLIGPNGEPMLSIKISSTGQVENIHVDDLVIFGGMQFTK